MFRVEIASVIMDFTRNHVQLLGTNMSAAFFAPRVSYTTLLACYDFTPYVSRFSRLTVLSYPGFTPRVFRLRTSRISASHHLVHEFYTVSGPGPITCWNCFRRIRNSVQGNLTKLNALRSHMSMRQNTVLFYLSLRDHTRFLCRVP